MTSSLGIYIFCFCHVLLAGDLKDDQNKAEKKDQSNVGNDSKKADGKGIILISFSINVPFNASLLELYLKLKSWLLICPYIIPCKKTLYLRKTVIPFSIIYKLLLHLFPSTMLSPSQMHSILSFPTAIFHCQL